jgi:hypothetical protein
MIVVITSWAPVRALRTPAIEPQAAPPRNPARMASGMWIADGRSHVNPTQPAQVAPITSWPAAPMLNRPARNASATDRPPSARGVASVSVRLSASGEPSELSNRPLYDS